MLNLLSFLAGWSEAWSASGRGSPTMSFVLGEPNRPKRSATAQVEGVGVSGQITVWESGECDIEAYDHETGEPVILESLSLKSEDELGSAIRRVLNACQG